MSTTKLQRRISRRLASLMERRGWTQTRLSAAIGISQPQLSRVLSGEATIGIDTLAAISHVCGGTIGEWLLPDEKKWQAAIDSYANLNTLSLVDRRRSRSTRATGTHCPASRGHVQPSDTPLTTTD